MRDLCEGCPPLFSETKNRNPSLRQREKKTRREVFVYTIRNIDSDYKMITGYSKQLKIASLKRNRPNYRNQDTTGFQ